MLKVQPEQDRMDDADQVSAPNPSCLELIVETDLTAEFPLTEAELRAIARLLGSELETILGLPR
ncbi:hypothetical protein [Devosia sp.]|uniref:hypothetical protein n=1 Tax=Devosia sp. TaxID=1871048 RepID=UPI0035B0D0B1